MERDRPLRLTFERAIIILVPLAIFAACYYDVLIWMYKRYMSTDSYYSHGFLIPFVSAYLVWQKRNKLAEQQASVSWWGLFILIAAGLVHLAGTVLYVFSLSGFSIFLLAIGVTLFLFGKEITRCVLFPLVFLAFMFPLPDAIVSAISFPMKEVVADVGVRIADEIGIPVFREGFYITIPAGSLLVGNPCSGLRSLIAFLALGSVYAYLGSVSRMRKWILFFSSIPIALLSNIIRVPILILISHYWGLSAAAPESFWHDASGIFVFIMGLVLLLVTGRVLGWKQ